LISGIVIVIQDNRFNLSTYTTLTSAQQRQPCFKCK